MRVEVLETAALAVVEQADWYEQNSSRTLADMWSRAIDQTIESLVTSPETGMRVRIRSIGATGLRWGIVQGFPKHLVYYRHFSSERVLQIVRVTHGARERDLLVAAGLRSSVPQA
jgi:plasmid stabilization system protein ParE